MRGKVLLIALLFLCELLSAQTTTKNTMTLKADSVKITNCDSAELIIENHTQGVPGYLYNTGKGRTVFQRPFIALNDSLYVFGKDTLNINKSNKYVTGGSGTTPTLSSVLTQGNVAIAGTATKAPIIMTKGVLNTTAVAGAVEYDGHGYYITDSALSRHDLTQTDREYQIYAQDYEPATGTTSDSIIYNLIGWNLDYTAGGDNSHTLISTIDIEITLNSGVPVNSKVTVKWQDSVVYTLTTTQAITTPTYVIGTVKINQDLKYPYLFYLRGATESVTAAGLITSTNTAKLRQVSTPYPTNPVLKCVVNSAAGVLIRVGMMYTVDKKQNGRWIYLD